ncbi:MAG: tryptophan--tRNA ligase [Candidatus Pacebacteria bacterium]|nr:tryptophan--tRNA ligase [Candidatus Paceibacterota bacterium]
MNKKRMLSGIQPTGAPHIGNYFGMIKQLVDSQESYEIFAMVVNYHALTTVVNGKQLQDNTKNVVLDFLGAGLDPEKVILFKQSDVLEHTELTWIFNCLVTMPWLSRAHAFKDKTEKGIEASVGLFDYPILMSADILLYDVPVVPVGEDQRQHVEMAREIARKFNGLYGETFIEPEEKIVKDVAIVPGTDGQKMSKSYGNIIPLFGTDAEIKKAVMSIVTDSKNPEDPKNPDDVIVYQLYKLVAPEKSDKMKTQLETGGLGYGDAKKMLLEAILEMVAPMRERRAYYENNPDLVEKILKQGGEKARYVAQEKMSRVRKLVGLE